MPVDMRKDILGDVEVTLHHETEKAWFVSDSGERQAAVWVPKSQAELHAEENGKSWTLTAPVWLLAEKGLA